MFGGQILIVLMIIFRLKIARIWRKEHGSLNVPFWEYWTSPYSSHYRPYT